MRRMTDDWRKDQTNVEPSLPAINGRPTRLRHDGPQKWSCLLGQENDRDKWGSAGLCRLLNGQRIEVSKIGCLAVKCRMGSSGVVELDIPTNARSRFADRFVAVFVNIVVPIFMPLLCEKTEVGRTPDRSAKRLRWASSFGSARSSGPVARGVPFRKRSFCFREWPHRVRCVAVPA